MISTLTLITAIIGLAQPALRRADAPPTPIAAAPPAPTAPSPDPTATSSGTGSVGSAIGSELPWRCDHFRRLADGRRGSLPIACRRQVDQARARRGCRRGSPTWTSTRRSPCSTRSGGTSIAAISDTARSRLSWRPSTRTGRSASTGGAPTSARSGPSRAHSTRSKSRCGTRPSRATASSCSRRSTTRSSTRSRTAVDGASTSPLDPDGWRIDPERLDGRDRRHDAG